MNASQATPSGQRRGCIGLSNVFTRGPVEELDMNVVTFRFYAELNDLLPEPSRFRDVEFEFHVAPTVKDAVESLGVPHTEIDVILVNGKSVDFGYRLTDGDRISVYPVFESLDVSDLVRLRPDPLRETKFVLDVHLGRLASLLRIAGFDTLYETNAADEDLVRTSLRQRRVLLTRDVGLLKRSELTHAYYVRSTERRAQFAEVLDRFDLRKRANPFTRCPRCNGLLEEVDRPVVEHLLQPGTASFFDDFRRCRDCGRPYWKGAHSAGLADLLDELGDFRGV